MKKKRHKKELNPKSKRLVMICSAILALALCAVAWVWMQIGATYHHGEATRIYIPLNSTAVAIEDTLRRNLGDGYGRKTARLWRSQGGTPEGAHGSYVVEPGTTTLQLSRRLLHRRQTPVRVTFNNIRTMEQLASRICNRIEATPEEFMAACDTVLQPMGFRKAGYPAAFLPDTYEFYWTTPATEVVAEIAGERNRFWNADRRAQASALGLTPVEVATVASIVEEETAKADERPKVARLYINRLKKNMKLQADPTVKYAVGDFSLRRITGEHLRKESPYNTYRHEGLPPGPIRVADRRTLEAVLSAPEHDYLYMCAKEDFSGYHNFATDYASHMANARRYQAELNKRNIH